jgi:hypothetical protein
LRRARAHLDPLSPGVALTKADFSEVSGNLDPLISLPAFVVVVLLIMAMAPRTNAQVNLGDASMHLTGMLSGGYSADYSNIANSDHNNIGAGVADLSGSYYNPNFLGFNISPFYNQSRLNSEFQSITAASGVNGTAAIFSGSNFPGTISYSKVYNSTGNYAVPQLANLNSEGIAQPASYSTNNDTDTLAINWGLNFGDWPRLNFSFINGGADYSLYGTNASGTTRFDTVSLTSSYKVAGFFLGGGFQHSGSNSLTPEVLVAAASDQSNSTTNTLSFNAAHALPWHGGASAGVTRSTVDTVDTVLGDSGSRTSYDATIDTLNGALNVTPIENLNAGFNAYYTDNLEGTLYNSLLTAGAIVPGSEAETPSDALSLTGYGNYDIGTHLHVRGTVTRQEQSFLGTSFASDSITGTVMYSNSLLGGYFTAVAGVTRTWLSGSTQYHATTGTNDSITYTRKVAGWNVNGAFGYSQDVETVLIAYTSSGFNYTGGIGRKLSRHTYWGAYAAGSKSLLTDEPGSSNSSRSYSTTLSLYRFSVSGSYGKANGNALLTPTGLVSTPVPVPILNPASVVLFNGTSYSAGLGASPVPGLTITASFSKGISDTQTRATNVAYSNNNNQNVSAILYYNFRKLNFTAGYSRLEQGFSISGVPPTNVGSYYFGVSRAFNFF